MKRLTIIAILLLFAAPGAFALQPDEVLPDAKLEARAREIGRSLRCLVCQNQSIDDSDAPLAHDLRVLVRQRLTAGDTDEQAEHYIVERYGDYVLLKPPFKPSTYVLWLGPAALTIVGLLSLLIYYKKRRVPLRDDLSAADKTRLEELMKLNPPDRDAA